MLTWPDLWFGPVNLISINKLEDKLSDKKVVVYSKLNCPACVVIKRQLTLNGVDFSEVRIDEDKEVAKWLVSQGHRQVPVVYVDGVHTTNISDLK